MEDPTPASPLSLNRVFAILGLLYLLTAPWCLEAVDNSRWRGGIDWFPKTPIVPNDNLFFEAATEFYVAPILLLRETPFEPLLDIYGRFWLHLRNPRVSGCGC